MNTQPMWHVDNMEKSDKIIDFYLICSNIL